MIRALTIGLVCFATSSALAEVQLWGGEPDDVTITDDDVRIDAAGTFKFQSVTGGSLDVIGNITVNDGVTGTVIVYIERDTDDDSPGATNVGSIDLTNNQGASLTGNLAELRITGNIATSGDLACTNITGDIDIGGNFGVSNGGTTLSADAVTGDITIDGVLVGGNFIDVGSLADLTIGTTSGNIQGNITVRGNYAGTMTLNRPFLAALTIEGNLTGEILGNSRIGGPVTIEGDLAVPGRIYSAGIASAGNPYVVIEIKGDLSGSGGSQPAIEVDSTLASVIAIDGSMADAVSGGPEIDVSSLGDPGAVAIDYDGWDDGDDWATGATIKVNTTTHSEPNDFIWHITECQGDVDNDGDIDGDDESAASTAKDAFGTFVVDYAGLQGSLFYHADLNCSGTPSDPDVDTMDVLAIRGLDGLACCDVDCQGRACAADVDGDGVVGLGDLAELLAVYGTTTSGLDVDFDQDDDVDLSDLSTLLGLYGLDCDCHSAMDGPGGELDNPSTVQITWQAIDTGGYSGGGFEGEVDHFVFDLKITVTDPNDDWTVSGAVLDAENDATFRLSSTVITPNQYATFVYTPWTTFPTGEGSVNLAGAYDPPDDSYDFTTTALNIGWFDTADSNNGPAAVMRLVLDVSEVDGADVSEGFGSVYYSKTGPANEGDIKLADVDTGTASIFAGSSLYTTTGAFYVIGEE